MAGSAHARLLGVIRWVTAFVDRPAHAFDATVAFWLAVTDTTLSPTRGRDGEFATLLPVTGDACLRVQRTGDGSAGSHIDLHVDDVRSTVDVASGLGATIADDLATLVVMRSPGGLPFCVVADRGERVRPAPVGVDGDRTIVDQVCIDIAPDRFDEECAFWEAIIGQALRAGGEPEFAVLDRPEGRPFRFLLQRRGGDDVGRTTSCHLDLACDDLDAATRSHVDRGAGVVARFPWWTVMADPAGVRYCLTMRDPETGRPRGR